MTIKFNRRLFLLGGLASGISVTGYGIFKWLTGQPQDIVVAILKRRLGYLNINHDDLLRFSSDYVAFKKSEQKKLRLLSLASHPMRFFSPYALLPQGNPLRRLENNVVSQFLLSSNYFHDGEDDAKTINYIQFYDPLNTICANPIMRFV